MNENPIDNIENIRSEFKNKLNNFLTTEIPIHVFPEEKFRLSHITELIHEILHEFDHKTKKIIKNKTTN